MVPDDTNKTVTLTAGAANYQLKAETALATVEVHFRYYLV